MHISHIPAPSNVEGGSLSFTSNIRKWKGQFISPPKITHSWNQSTLNLSPKTLNNSWMQEIYIHQEVNDNISDSPKPLWMKWRWKLILRGTTKGKIGSWLPTKMIMLSFSIRNYKYFWFSVVNLTKQTPSTYLKLLKKTNCFCILNITIVLYDFTYLLMCKLNTKLIYLTLSMSTFSRRNNHYFHN